MKVQLWDKPNRLYTAKQQILSNRGIPIDRQQRWLAASPGEQYGWEDLEKEKMIDGCNHLAECIKNNWTVWSVKDCDNDGTSVLALVYNFFYKYFPKWTLQHFKYDIHAGKQHGLSDMMDKIPEDTKMVLVFDAGSNDIEEHKELVSNGIYVFIGDHHDVDINIEDSPATIVNVQTSNYKDKELTGSGVGYRFIQAFNDLYIHDEEPTDFMDLACLGIISDMAKYQNLEIRSMVIEGLSNIQNPLVKEFVKRHEYTLDKRNGINYLSMAFAYCPFQNCLDRSGTMEEKEFVFKGMLTPYADKLVDDSRRGHKGEKVKWCEEAVTVCERVKRRQTQVQEQETVVVKKKIEDNHLDEHSIILALLEPDEGEPNINGLTATQIAAKYQKPSAVLIRQETDEGITWSGSMRNAPNAEKDDLRAELEKTGAVEFVAGHSNAGGLCIKDENVQEFLRRFDEQYKDVDMECRFMVDYDWSMNQVDKKKILDIAHLDIYGQGIPESLVAIHDIDLSKCKIQLLGKSENTVKITLPNGVSIMKFQTDRSFYDMLIHKVDYYYGNVGMSIVGKPNDNEWNDMHYPQIIMEDYEIQNDWYVF